MARMITIDPITRIEGHLRIDVEVDRGKVTDSWSSGQMWRGIERILEGRDPRDAWIFTQRICGVCTTVHAITSVRAVENALGIEVPLNAQLIRNLLIAAHGLHDHIVHFYHLSALDWVDVVSALKGNPTTTARLAESLSPWPGNGVKDLTAAMFPLFLADVEAVRMQLFQEALAQRLPVLLGKTQKRRHLRLCVHRPTLVGFPVQVNRQAGDRGNRRVEVDQAVTQLLL